MHLKTPEFWYRLPKSSAPLQETLLSPISCIYQLGHKVNLCATKTNTVPIPVICVGNITVGGSGKTPTCLALNKLIIEKNLAQNPYFLSRGYGGDDHGPRCIKGHEDAKAVGDEPLLLAKHSNTIISKVRYKGALLAHKLSADCLIMDDGLQNQSLRKDVSFMIVNGKMGFGNGKTLPAGPLRENLDFALKRVDAVIIIGNDERRIRVQIPEHIPIFGGNIQPCSENSPNTSKQYIAFCGLAYPKKFYDTLQENEFKVIECKSFPDHYTYSQGDLDRLKELAKKNNAYLITTEKDYVRLPETAKKDIQVLPVKLLLCEEDKIIRFLQNKLKSFKEE